METHVHIREVNLNKALWCPCLHCSTELHQLCRSRWTVSLCCLLHNHNGQMPRITSDRYKWPSALLVEQMWTPSSRTSWPQLSPSTNCICQTPIRLWSCNTCHAPCVWIIWNLSCDPGNAAYTFKSLNWQAALHNIHHLCCLLSKVFFNIYREDIQLFIDGKILCFQYFDAPSIELHGFCDACESAYAGVVYIRATNIDCAINHTALVRAKTKVAPIKRLSIPPLEFCGAF